jgi:hypothetical protein
MLLQAVEIILEHCAVLQPELRREEQGGRGLHHAAKMKCVKAASKFGCSLLGVSGFPKALLETIELS